MIRKAVSPLLLLFLLLSNITAMAAPPPGMPTPGAGISMAIPSLLRNAPELAMIVRDWDEQSVLAIEVSRQAPQKVLNRSEMPGIQLETAGGETVRLDNLFDTVFSAQRATEQQLLAIPASALMGKPHRHEAVVEFPDRLVMLRQIRVVVRDPSQAVAAAPELARFLSPVDPAKVAQTRVSQLDSDVQLSLRRFIAEDLPRRDADDPLRQAFVQGGEDALLRAMLSGVGEFEITDQVVVERRPFNDGSLRVAAALKFMSMTPRSSALAPKELRPATTRHESFDPSSLGGHAARGSRYRYPPGDSFEGRLEFNEGFLAGFTLGKELAWERRWNFSGNFLRVSYGIGYGIGLRVPIIIDGRLVPTQGVRSAVDDTGHDITLHVKAATADKDDVYFSQVGLPTSQLFSGHEFVLTGGSWLSLKLHALGKDWLHISPINSPVHHSHDIVPPLGGSASPIFTFEIPPELTNTEMDFGVLTGALVVGIGMDGIGSILLPYSLLVDGEPLRTERLSLNNSHVHTETLRLPPLQAEPRTIAGQSFGLHLDSPSYLLQANAATRLKLKMAIDVGPLERTIETDWFTVFSMPIGQVVLHPHVGTKAGYTWNEGVRIFEARDPRDPASMQAPRVVPPLR